MGRRFSRSPTFLDGMILSILSRIILISLCIIVVMVLPQLPTDADFVNDNVGVVSWAENGYKWVKFYTTAIQKVTKANSISILSHISFILGSVGIYTPNYLEDNQILQTSLESLQKLHKSTEILDHCIKHSHCHVSNSYQFTRSGAQFGTTNLDNPGLVNDSDHIWLRNHKIWSLSTFSSHFCDFNGHSQPLLLGPNNTLINPITDIPTLRPNIYGISRILKFQGHWDGAFFQQLAITGYIHEKMAAFYPLLPSLLNQISNFVVRPIFQFTSSEYTKHGQHIGPADGLKNKNKTERHQTHQVHTQPIMYMSELGSKHITIILVPDIQQNQQNEQNQQNQQNQQEKNKNIKNSLNQIYSKAFIDLNGQEPLSSQLSQTHSLTYILPTILCDRDVVAISTLIYTFICHIIATYLFIILTRRIKQDLSLNIVSTDSFLTSLGIKTFFFAGNEKEKILDSCEKNDLQNDDNDQEGKKEVTKSDEQNGHQKDQISTTGSQSKKMNELDQRDDDDDNEHMDQGSTSRSSGKPSKASKVTSTSSSKQKQPTQRRSTRSLSKRRMGDDSDSDHNGDDRDDDEGDSIQQKKKQQARSTNKKQQQQQQVSEDEKEKNKDEDKFTDGQFPLESSHSSQSTPLPTSPSSSPSSPSSPSFEWLSLLIWILSPINIFFLASYTELLFTTFFFLSLISYANTIKTVLIPLKINSTRTIPMIKFIHHDLSLSTLFWWTIWATATVLAGATRSNGVLLLGFPVLASILSSLDIITTAIQSFSLFSFQEQHYNYYSDLKLAYSLPNGTDHWKLPPLPEIIPKKPNFSISKFFLKPFFKLCLTNAFILTIGLCAALGPIMHVSGIDMTHLCSYHLENQVHKFSKHQNDQNLSQNDQISSQIFENLQSFTTMLTDYRETRPDVFGIGFDLSPISFQGGPGDFSYCDSLLLFFWVQPDFSLSPEISTTLSNILKSPLLLMDESIRNDLWDIITSFGIEIVQYDVETPEKSPIEKPILSKFPLKRISFMLRSHSISIYRYIQSNYWDIGFMKYYTPQQIPNFILALPIFYTIFYLISTLVLSPILIYIQDHHRFDYPDVLLFNNTNDINKGHKNNGFFHFFKKIFIFFISIIQIILASLFSLGLYTYPPKTNIIPQPIQNDQGGKNDNTSSAASPSSSSSSSSSFSSQRLASSPYPTPQTLFIGSISPLLLPLIVLVVAMAMFAAVLMHIQVSTRFILVSPILYWVLAIAHSKYVQEKYPELVNNEKNSPTNDQNDGGSNNNGQNNKSLRYDATDFGGFDAIIHHNSGCNIIVPIGDQSNSKVTSNDRNNLKSPSSYKIIWSWPLIWCVGYTITGCILFPIFGPWT